MPNVNRAEQNYIHAQRILIRLHNIFGRYHNWELGDNPKKPETPSVALVENLLSDFHKLAVKELKSDRELVKSFVTLCGSFVDKKLIPTRPLNDLVMGYLMMIGGTRQEFWPQVLTIALNAGVAAHFILGPLLARGQSYLTSGLVKRVALPKLITRILILHEAFPKGNLVQIHDELSKTVSYIKENLPSDIEPALEFARFCKRSLPRVPNACVAKLILNSLSELKAAGPEIHKTLKEISGGARLLFRVPVADNPLLLLKRPDFKYNRFYSVPVKGLGVPVKGLGLNPPALSPSN